MFSKPRVIFVTGYCSHYRLPVFEMLSGKYEMNFIFTEDGEKLGWDNYGSLDYALCRSKFRLMLKALRGQCDIYITNFPIWTSPLEFLAVKLRRRKLIFWSGEWHQPNTLTRKIATPILKFVAKRCDAIVVYGSPQKTHMLSYGAKQDKIFLAPNASLVDTSYDAPKVRRESNGRKVILYLGRLTRYKGADYLIKAFAKIERERNNVVLLIGGDGDFGAELEKLCRQLSLCNVMFLGAVALEDRAYYYQMCDVFVLPSIWQPDYCEAWGLTLNEAMQFGKPVIATDAVGAAFDLIEDGINGFMVKNADTDALYEAIEKIISDPELERRMGLESKRIIAEGFMYEHMVKGFGEAIRSVLRDY
jgi:glycosyltransferase involved in cell wall biosynthesis